MLMTDLTLESVIFPAPIHWIYVLNSFYLELIPVRIQPTPSLMCK